MSGGAHISAGQEDNPLEAGLPRIPPGDGRILVRPQQDLRIATWKAVPEAIRAIADVAEDFEIRTGRQLEVRPRFGSIDTGERTKEGLKIFNFPQKDYPRYDICGDNTTWGYDTSSYPVPLEVSAEHFREAAYIMEYYNSCGDKPPPGRYPDMPELDDFYFNKPNLPDYPVILESKKDPGTGEERLYLNHEHLAENVERWEECLRRYVLECNLDKFDGCPYLYAWECPEPMSGGAGRVLTMFSTIVMPEPQPDGSVVDKPLTMPEVFLEPES